MPRYDVIVVGDYFVDLIFNGLPQFPALGKETVGPVARHTPDFLHDHFQDAMLGAETFAVGRGRLQGTGRVESRESRVQSRPACFRLSTLSSGLWI